MKNKKGKKIIIMALLLAMIAMYGALPTTGAKAVNSIRDASATLSDSDLGVLATSTFRMLTTTALDAGGYIEVTVHNDYSLITATSTVDCDTGGGEFVYGTRTLRCVYAAGLAASTTRTITIGALTNPATDGFRRMDIKSYNSGGTLLDQVAVMVYVIKDVWMTATVDPILIFTLNGVNGMAGTAVNGINCTATTTATTTPFGTLVVNATSTVCQRLNVTTNADDGYIVTVEQDMELTSDSGSNINSFDNSVNGVGSTTPHTWRLPNNTLDAYHTYGHMGLTSNDQDLSSFAYNNYWNGGGTAQYVGLNGTAPVVVMHHDGPSDGLAQNIGVTMVAYSAQIGSLQEAGDYESRLTYIATPTY